MKTGTGLVIFFIFIIVVALFIYLFSTGILNSIFGFSNKIYVSGISLEINNANAINCFGNVIQPLPGLNVSEGTPFNYTFNMTNSCPKSHNVTSINVTNVGFKTDVISPKLQYQMFQNNKVPFRIIINPPQSFSGGILNLQVNVT